jgi:RHH-type proline utilization regulon transcriptional repressor/proline dehydrogenase/delta 1-pyrroline-5-carboxylate dehydrogenase
MNITEVSQDVFRDEHSLIENILSDIHFDFRQNNRIKNTASDCINTIKTSSDLRVENFLQVYNLSTIEGVAIMCLAESLSRISDDETAFALVVDKLSQKEWAMHFYRAQSTFVKLASLGLTFSGKWSDFCDTNNMFSNFSKRISQPMFLAAIRQAINWLGSEFIIGETIGKAIVRTRRMRKRGYDFSFDLLGESSRTFTQSEKYYQQYLDAVDVIDKSGIAGYNLSIKLTSLYPRFELTKLTDIKTYLLPRLLTLVSKMHMAGISITFDAEESHRLECYLHIVTELLAHPECKNIQGIGFVVQAYQKCASKVLDYIINLAKSTERQIPVRLVKGAYWDTEIKHAQTKGLVNYPVFTQKSFTDANYISCAKKMLANSNYIYPQFATHNALTAATMIELAGTQAFEFQKLHGMGTALHNELKKNYKIRIYAPIGNMEDVLAYLMRRILENGANTSFVRQVAFCNTPELVRDLHDTVRTTLHNNCRRLPLPLSIYHARNNSIGYEMGYQFALDELHTEVSAFDNKRYNVGPIVGGKELLSKKHSTEHFRPGKVAEKIGDISLATASDMSKAVVQAKNAFDEWQKRSVGDRADILRKIADLYQENRYELYSILIREGGKSISDAIDEVREAIDFCRYYALSAEKLMQEQSLPGTTGERNTLGLHGRGIFLCISPWNFPLAIFTGQIVAALVTGNAVLAKPSQQTPIIANFVVKLMHKASVPQNILHLVIASGNQIEKYIVPNNDVSGVVFTGSISTAKRINMTLAARDGAIVPIIAETGGQNAMIVDSSALLEQVTDDVLTSAFHSAGQRCSALRVLYIQEDIYDKLLVMLKDALATLRIGDTLDFANDIGPVIDKASYEMLAIHIEDIQNKGFKILASHPQKSLLQDGYYFYPHILEISNMRDIGDEKFGPILHVVRYKYSDIDKVIDEINSSGFGLTFGVHSRIEKRIEYIRSRIKAGNIYANRSMIGAQVESQPFGGENKSGTGFKAGGPYYLLKFLVERTMTVNLTAIGGNIELLR